MTKQVFDISVVVPVYNEEESLPELYEWIIRVADHAKLSVEILFINDGSTDSSWQVIKNLSEKNHRVKGVKFNRNYGKSAALNVGFHEARGEVVMTFDADLQDSPDEIPSLYAMMKEGDYHLISGWKKKRHDPIGKTLPSRFFNRVTRWVSGIPLHDFNCGLKAYRNEVVKNIEVYGEMHRYIPLLAKWNGYTKIGEKVVEHRPRKYGKTKFGFERFLNGFLDLISVSFVTRFRKRPMHFFGSLGISSFLFGFVITAWVIGEKLYKIFQHQPARDITNQPLFFLALVAIVLGTQLFLAGFLAEMILQVNPKKSDYLITDRVGDA